MRPHAAGILGKFASAAAFGVNDVRRRHQLFLDTRNNEHDAQHKVVQSELVGRSRMPDERGRNERGAAIDGLIKDR